jgi:hypothetical protein
MVPWLSATCGSNRCRSDAAHHAGAPFVVIAEFAFLEADAGIGDAEVLFDAKEILELFGGERFERLTELGSDPDGAAIGFEDFHFEVGILDADMAPGDSSVIAHQDGVVLFDEVGHELAHFGCAWGAVGSDGDPPDEDLDFGDHAGGGFDLGDSESGGVRRVTMDGGLGAGLPFHDLEMHEDLAGAVQGAGELFAVEIDQAKVFGFHEPLGDEGGCAEGEIIADADGDIPAVAIDIGTFPEAASDFADLEFQFLEGIGVEEGFEFGGGAFGGNGLGGGRGGGGGWRGRLGRMGCVFGFAVEFQVAEQIAGGGGDDGVGREWLEMSPLRMSSSISLALMTFFMMGTGGVGSGMEGRLGGWLVEDVIDQRGVDGVDGGGLVERCGRFATFDVADGLSDAGPEIVVDDEAGILAEAGGVECPAGNGRG